MSTITVIFANLSVEGLSITYDAGICTNNVCLDPAASCDLLQQLGAIEAFELDQNREPVILFTDNQYGRIATGWDYWCNFHKSFPMTNRIGEMIIQHIQDTKQFNRLKGKIKYLLQPLNAA